jgi:hypothetical protein
VEHNWVKIRIIIPVFTRHNEYITRHEAGGTRGPSRIKTEPTPTTTSHPLLPRASAAPLFSTRIDVLSRLELRAKPDPSLTTGPAQRRRREPSGSRDDPVGARDVGGRQPGPHRAPRRGLHAAAPPPGVRRGLLPAPPLRAARDVAPCSVAPLRGGHPGCRGARRRHLRPHLRVQVGPPPFSSASPLCRVRFPAQRFKAVLQRVFSWGVCSIRVFSAAAVLGVGVLAPVNFLGDQLRETDFSDLSNKSIDLFSISNVKDGSNKWGI